MPEKLLHRPVLDLRQEAPNLPRRYFPNPDCVIGIVLSAAEPRADLRTRYSASPGHSAPDSAVSGTLRRRRHAQWSSAKTGGFPACVTQSIRFLQPGGFSPSECGMGFLPVCWSFPSFLSGSAGPARVSLTYAGVSPTPGPRAWYNVVRYRARTWHPTHNAGADDAPVVDAIGRLSFGATGRSLRVAEAVSSTGEFGTGGC